MRPSLPLAATLLLIAPVALDAQTAPAPVQPSAKTTAPAAQAPAKKTGPAGEKPAEEPKITGIVLNRAGGGFLGVETEGVTLKVTFYNEKKEKVAADAVRITARWQDVRPRHAVLLPASPETLVSPPVLTRPFSYIVYLVLVGADDKPLETFSLRLNGSGG